jgi:hypothetical protein
MKTEAKAKILLEINTTALFMYSIILDMIFEPLLVYIFRKREGLFFSDIW